MASSNRDRLVQTRVTTIWGFPLSRYSAEGTTAAAEPPVLAESSLHPGRPSGRPGVCSPQYPPSLLQMARGGPALVTGVAEKPWGKAKPPSSFTGLGGGRRVEVERARLLYIGGRNHTFLHGRTRPEKFKAVYPQTRQTPNRPGAWAFPLGPGSLLLPVGLATGPPCSRTLAHSGPYEGPRGPGETTSVCAPNVRCPSKPR